MSIIYALVSSGAKVSPDINVTQGVLQAIAVPPITSGDLYLQGGFDTTSANFLRLNDDVGDILYATGPGSKMMLWPAGLQTPGYLRAEFSVAQTDNRTLTLLVRDRL